MRILWRRLPALPAFLLSASVFLLSFRVAGSGAEELQTEALLAQGWEELSRFRAQEALRFFEKRLVASPGDREAELGRALCLLGLQPLSMSNIEAAESRLAALASDRSAPFAAEAAYQHARLPDVHWLIRDESEALRRYEEFIGEFPGHPLAEMAKVKRAILIVYGLGETGVEERFRRAEAEGFVPVGAPARRDFYSVLADGAAFFRLPSETTRRYLREVESTGALTGNAVGDLLLRLGVLSAENGDREAALAYFRRFLEAFPRNERATLVRDRIRELEETGR